MIPSISPRPTRASNFGTIPSLMANLTAQPATRSWWIGLSPAQFYAQVPLEFERMRGSRGSRWVDQLSIVNLSDWI